MTAPLFAVDLAVVVPVAVGAAVGVVVLTVFAVRKRRHMPEPKVETRGTEWETSESSFADRRSTLRREGRPVKIVASSQAFRNGVEGGYVLDRSTGGLRIALTKAMAPGSLMQLRAHNAPETVPWVTVVVRNCRDAGQHFELGVEFDQTPPWNVLLLFG